MTRRGGRRWDFLRSWLSAGYAYDQRCRVPSRHFLDLYPMAESMTVRMGDVRYRRSNVNPLEAYCLSCLVMMRRPRRIFEIGTFDGATTLLLARAHSESEVLTLDLAPGDLDASHPASVSDEVKNVAAGGVGSRYKGQPEAQRIRQLLDDSTAFDYGPYAATCDLVFIDACHDEAFVRSDTKSALQLLAPGGIIVWHDYIAGWPGVVRTVDALLDRYAIYHVAGTSLAIYDPNIDGAKTDAPPQREP